MRGACGVPEQSPTAACPGSLQAEAPLPTEAAAPLSGIDADNMHSDSAPFVPRLAHGGWGLDSLAGVRRTPALPSGEALARCRPVLLDGL